MKILLSTIGFSNPDLLKGCISSWPEHVYKGLLWQGTNEEMHPVFSRSQENTDFRICIRSLYNWGFTGGCNIILKTAFKDGFDAVVIVGSDTEMKSGFWNDFISDCLGNDFVESSHQFNCFYMTRKCFEIVGTFDENFFPAYCEDDDYRIRVKLSGIKYRIDAGDKNLLWHYGSATVRKNQLYQFKSAFSFKLNKEYMQEKWGAIESSSPKWKTDYKNPFNNPEWEINKWVLNPKQRIMRHWEHPPSLTEYRDKKYIQLIHSLLYPEVYTYSNMENEL